MCYLISLGLTPACDLLSHNVSQSYSLKGVMLYKLQVSIKLSLWVCTVPLFWISVQCKDLYMRLGWTLFSTRSLIILCLQCRPPEIVYSNWLSDCLYSFMLACAVSYFVIVIKMYLLEVIFNVMTRHTSVFVSYLCFLQLAFLFVFTFFLFYGWIVFDTIKSKNLHM